MADKGLKSALCRGQHLFPVYFCILFCFIVLLDTHLSLKGKRARFAGLRLNKKSCSKHYAKIV